MFELTEEIKEEIKLAIGNPDIECCGIIDQEGNVFGMTNMADDPSEEFAFEASEWAAFGDEAIAIWHTHPKDTQPSKLSPGDLENSRLQGLPYILLNTAFDEWDLFDPEDAHPYPLKKTADFDPSNPEHWLGLPWEYGRCDCYSLFRGWYKGLGIDLRDYPRGEDPNERFSPVWDLFLESYEKEGFIGIDPAEAWTPAPGQKANLQQHDVLLMTMPGSTNPVHCALVADDPSTMRILHHLGGEGQLLCRHPLNKSYRDRTVLILRHQSLIDAEVAEEKEEPIVDIWEEKEA